MYLTGEQPASDLPALKDAPPSSQSKGRWTVWVTNAQKPEKTEGKEKEEQQEQQENKDEEECECNFGEGKYLNCCL